MLLLDRKKSTQYLLFIFGKVDLIYDAMQKSSGNIEQDFAFVKRLCQVLCSPSRLCSIFPPVLLQ